MKRLYLKRVLRSALLVLLLAGMGKVNAQCYNYDPPLGEYTEIGSTTEYVQMNQFSSNCSFMSTIQNYYLGHVHTCLYSHNTSSGLMKFRVEKCDNNYYFGSSGKMVIVEDNSTVVLCESYSSGPHYIEKSFYHSTFSDLHWFDVYIFNSDIQSYLYAGRVVVRGANAPIVETDDYASTITTNSADVGGTVNPQGLATNYYFQYGTSSSFGSTAGEGSLDATYTTHGVGAQLTGLQPNTRYYYRLRAYNDAGTTNGTTYYFTTEDDTSAPEVTTNNATNISAYSATLKGTVNPKGLTTIAWFEYGTTTSLGTTTTTISLDNSYFDFPIEQVLYNLQPNTRYYYRAYASNSKGQTQGSRNYFDTDAGGDPIVTTGNADPIESTSATITGTINPQGLITNYFFTYGTTTNYELGQTVQGTLAASTSNQTVSANLTGLIPNTTYHYRLFATNNHGSQYGNDGYFTTLENLCYFTDCTSGEVHDAALFLCERGVVTGDAGTHTLRPNDNITRGELSKAAFFGLYSNSNGVSIPNPLVTDYFPCIYPDLQQSSFYFQAAKALLYLEYGDGVSPLDRNRSCFNPNGTITRHHVLKVLLETFNIAPAENNGSNPFGNYYLPSQEGWGYVKKAKDLGILVLNGTADPRPWDNCTRGEAFLFLYRILYKIDNNTLTKPIPNYDTYNPLESDFFVPANLSPDVVNAIRGVEYGNFNYYNKDFFNIPGYMNLDFGISYNSYLTEMPNEFYPIKPMGKAWTHTYDMYMNVIADNYNNISYYVFHMQEGALLIYKTENGALTKYTEGNYYTINSTTPSASSYTLTSTGQISYTFTRKSDGIYYLTQIKDRFNNTITINIGSGGSHYRVNSVATLGRTLTFGYTSDTLLSYVKDPTNRYVYFYYDGDQNPLKQLSSCKDAKNQTTHFHYGTLDSEKGLLKEIQLPKGNYVYNDYQRRKLKSMSYYGISSQTHTDIAITPNYQNGTTVSTVTETLSGNQSVTTTYTMNDKNRVTHITDNNNTDISYQYGEGYLDNPDLLTKKTDNKTGLQTSFAYDTSNGFVTSKTYSNGSETHTIRVNYNSFNDVADYTDANNNVTRYGYDPVSHYLISITDAMGKITYIDNNSHGVPTRVTNPMGMSVEYDYNDYGNLDEISIPSLNLTATMSYDAISRMVSKTDFAGHLTQYTYDANDNLKTITDANGKTTTYEYDANDNVIWIQNARGYKTNMTYDFNTDFMTQVEFQSHTRSYTYKKDGSLESFTDPNGNTFNYTYNNSGELINDGYASLGYNSNTGQLETVTKDGKSITYTYDAFNRISSVSYDGKTVGYTYDNNDNVKTIVYPGNKTVTYFYDALNRITSVKDWNNKTTTYDYRDDGQLNYYQYPNGVRTTYGYDNSGRCNSISTKRNSGNGSVIAEYSFELDNMGNHLTETFTEPYAAYPSIPSANINYSYNTANRLTLAGDLSFGYDDNGNTISRTGRTYGYDTKDNLTSVSGDFSASYTYDGLGNRRTATRNGVTTKYVLNLLASMPTVLMETNASGTVQNYYIYGPSGLISRIDANNNTNYYVYDFRGSTVAMTDASTSANLTHKYQFDDFGKLLQSEEADYNPFRYVGKYGVMFEDDALTFMRARYYDPEIGRFLSEDPIWSANLYPYVDNNPIMRIDPNGELFLDFACIIVGGLDFAFFGSDHPVLDIVLSGTVTAIGIIATVAGSPIVATVAAVAGAVMTVGSLTCNLIELHYDKVAARNAVETSRTISSICEKREKEQKAAQAAKKTAAPKFQVDEEAMDWIFQAKSNEAYKLKRIFMEVAWSDRTQTEKQKIWANCFKKAHEYMPK